MRHVSCLHAQPLALKDPVDVQSSFSKKKKKMACCPFQSHHFIDRPSSESVCSEAGGRICILVKIPLEVHQP